MPRKKRIAVFVILSIIAIMLAVGIFIYLYLNTDAFKSNQKLFFKYFEENINILNYLKVDESSTKNDTPYNSELTGEIEYTENVDTSDENKNNNINKVKLNINNQVDKQNNFYEHDCKVQTANDDLAEFETLKQDGKNAYRLGGIKQFIELENTYQNNSNKSDEEKYYEDIENFMNDIDLNSIFEFSDEEKKTLTNTYTKLIQDNISKDEFQKNKNVTIKIGDKTYYANAYYVTLKVERYNNLSVKFLEQLKEDEIILSRIDKIENIIKEKYADYNPEKSLRENFVSKIETKIDDIQNNNIGSDTVTITVYENMRKILSTEIKKTDATYSVDFVSNSKVNVDLKNTNTSDEKIFSWQNNVNNKKNTVIEYKELQENKMIYNIKIEKSQEVVETNIKNSLNITISNEKYEAILNLKYNIEYTGSIQKVNSDDIFTLSKFDENEQNRINEILNSNKESMKNNVNSIVTKDDYKKMLENLEIIKTKSITMPNTPIVTEIEKSRFNQQFEFFISDDLSKDKIVELMSVSQKNFGGAKLILSNGNEENIDIDKITAKTNEASAYKKTIAGYDITIKEGSINDTEYQNVLTCLDQINCDKYSVTVKRDENGLVNQVIIKMVNDR